MPGTKEDIAQRRFAERGGRRGVLDVPGTGKVISGQEIAEYEPGHRDLPRDVLQLARSRATAGHVVPGAWHVAVIGCGIPRP